MYVWYVYGIIMPFSRKRRIYYVRNMFVLFFKQNCENILLCYEMLKCLM